MTAPAKSGSLVSHVGYGSNRSVSFSTTGTDKQIFAFCYGDAALSELSFAGGGLTWILIGSIEASISNKNCVKIYTARAATAITSQTLTLTKTGGDTDLVLHVQAWEGCPDYTGLVANTDFGLGTYNPTVEAVANPTVNVTTIGEDSQLIGISGLLFWEDGYTAITGTTRLDSAARAALVERNSAPLASGTYTMGVIHGAGSANWRATVGAFVEILGIEAGGTETDLTVAGNTHGQTADNVVLTTNATLGVNDTGHAHTVDNITLSTGSALVVADTSHGHSVDNITLSTGVTLVIADMSHAQVVEGLNLSVDSTLAIAHVLHGHLIDNLNISTESVLAIADTLHAQTLDNLTLSSADSVSLTVAGLTHAHQSDNVDLTTEVSLVIADMLHALFSDNVSLGVAGSENLVIANVSHGHTAESIALSTEITLAIAKALHAHFADGLDLSTDSLLVVDDSLHAHVVDQITLDTIDGTNLNIDDLAHGQVVDGLVLSTDSVLAIADTLHSHLVDHLGLSVDATLAIAETLHAHIVDNLLLDITIGTVIYGRRVGHINVQISKRLATRMTRRVASIQTSRRK